MMHEFGDVELGDERLNNRFLDIVGAMASSPGAPFAGLFAQESAVEAVYRFMRNPKVQWEDILGAHVEQTRERCAQAGSVVVIHDTTTHRLCAEAEIESYINTGKKGFLGHTSLAVENRGGGRPLGVLAMECVLRAQKSSKLRKKGRPLSGAETARLKNKEYDRWLRGIEASHEQMGDDVEVVHVIDREGDSFGLFGRLAVTDKCFVIRECKNRLGRLAGSNSEEWAPVDELLKQARKTHLQREVYLGRRDQKTAPGNAKANPARANRMAHLRIAYASLELRRPGYLKSDDCPPTVTVNVVHVYEVDPPAGEQRIEWVLLTNLPVRSAAEAERIIDIYRLRWLIEEFFAALKGGCRYRQRRLTNRYSIFNTLASMIPIAWKALDLRQLARFAECKAVEVFDSIQFDTLVAKARTMRKRLNRTTSAQEAMLIIARLGGHLKSSGPPGWKTLMKGMERFLGIAEGYALARAKM